HAAVFTHGFQELETLDGFLQRRPVGERAAEPAVIYEELAALLGLFGDRFLRLALGADKQNALARGGNFADEAARFAEHLQRFLKIDNVNAVALAEDVFLHLRIPTPGLVTE